MEDSSWRTLGNSARRWRALYFSLFFPFFPFLVVLFSLLVFFFPVVLFLGLSLGGPSLALVRFEVVRTRYPSTGLAKSCVDKPWRESSRGVVRLLCCGEFGHDFVMSSFPQLANAPRVPGDESKLRALPCCEHLSVMMISLLLV